MAARRRQGRPRSGREVRGDQLRVRLTPAEKAEIQRRADRLGVDKAELVRRRALTDDFPQVGGHGLTQVSAQRRWLGLPEVEPEPSIEEAKQEHPPVPPRVEAEIAESKMPDAEAEEAFMARRTRELYAEGKTTPVARALARAEWRDRGR